MFKNAKLFEVVLLAIILMTLQACEREVFFGRIVIEITDGPFPIEIIEEASIRVFKFEAHQVGSEEDAGMILISEDTMIYNLIDLRNGVTENLAESEIKTGEYDYFRMYVDKASLTIIDGESFDVKVPSGSTSGIKVKIDRSVLVEEGLTSELLLDIDLSKSFVLKGNYNTPAGIKGFNFKPVVRAINISDAGRIEGYVKDTEAKPIDAVSIEVSFESDTYSTFSDSKGYYNIIGLPTGIYSLVAEKEDYNTLNLDNIVVVAANRTTRNLELVK
jgi:hypothetical protein